MTLRNRLDRLEKTSLKSTIVIRMQAGESTEQAQSRWLAEYPDRMVDLERARVFFIRRVFVDAGTRQ